MKLLGQFVVPDFQLVLILEQEVQLVNEFGAEHVLHAGWHTKY